VLALRAKGLSEKRVFQHVLKNAAPTAVAVMGLQLGYLLGGSILIETVFSWPGTGFLLNSAIFQRDLPLLQGTILVLALFFVVLNLLVDVLQAAIDPRIKRA
jgi:peptide/nickel transport system permease protein